MKTISAELIESLKTLGLTEYEAKVYSALVLFERTEVKQIYEYLDAPKPSVYQSLKTLMDKGLVQVVNAKPAVYRATPPKIALKHMTEIHKNAETIALKELEELEQSRVEDESPDVLWTLYGTESIEHNMEELLGKVKGSVRLILPDHYLDYLELLRDRDVEVNLIAFGKDSSLAEKYGLRHATVHDALKVDLSDFASIAQYFSRLPVPPENFTKFIMILVDDSEFMYIPPLPGKTKTGLTSMNPMIVALIGIIFGAIWDHSPEV